MRATAGATSQVRVTACFSFPVRNAESVWKLRSGGESLWIAGDSFGRMREERAAHQGCSRDHTVPIPRRSCGMRCAVGCQEVVSRSCIPKPIGAMREETPHRSGPCAGGARGKDQWGLRDRVRFRPLWAQLRGPVVVLTRFVVALEKHERVA